MLLRFNIQGLNEALTQAGILKQVGTDGNQPPMLPEKIK